MELASDLLSPELVLVSPPDDAERARSALPPMPLWTPVPVAHASGRLPFVTFCAVCLVTTLGPLALIAAVH